MSHSARHLLILVTIVERTTTHSWNNLRPLSFSAFSSQICASAFMSHRDFNFQFPLPPSFVPAQDEWKIDRTLRSTKPGRTNAMKWTLLLICTTHIRKLMALLQICLEIEAEKCDCPSLRATRGQTLPVTKLYCYKRPITGNVLTTLTVNWNT